MTDTTVRIGLTADGAKAKASISAVEASLGRLNASVRHASHYGAGLAVALGVDLPARILQTLPSRIADLAFRHVLLPQFNLTVSNVRGPATSLYLAGAKVYAFMPLNVLFDGLGLSITGFSYNGTLWVSAVADRAVMPDPEFFMDCFRESFAEHLALTLRAPEGEAGPARRTARKAAPVAQASRPADQPAAATKPVRKPAVRRKPRAATMAPE